MGKYFSAWWRQSFHIKIFDRYTKLLLNQKIRLQQIPLRIILNPAYCYALCLTALRVDRSVSREAFEDDVSYLYMLKQMVSDGKNPGAHCCLHRVMEVAAWQEKLLLNPIEYACASDQQDVQ